MAPDIIAESVGYTVVSASGNISPKSVAMVGIFVSGATGTPTITIYDDAATGTTVPLVTTFTPAPATYYKLPFRALHGINIVIGGTVSCTVGLQTETLM